MTRNLKALGLMAVAALAMSAMFASTAQAQKGVFTGGETPETHENVTVTGTQYDTIGSPWNYLEVFGEQRSCDNVHFTGTINGGTATDVTVTPSYTECEVGGSPTTVTTNGCTYTFTQPETAEDVPEGSYTGKVDLVCPSGKAIVIHVYAFGSSTKGTHFGNICTIEMFPKTGTSQELGGHVVYTSKVTEATGWDDVTVAATLEGIHMTSTCPGGGTTDEGIYKTTITMKALEDPEGEPHVEERDLWISHAE